MLYVKELTSTGCNFREATVDEVKDASARITVYTPGDETITSSELAKRAAEELLRHCEEERFVAFYLDNQHTIIDYRTHSKGTINSATVYPREIAKAALSLNAAAVILAHNHPSGVPTPSQADKVITRRIKDALSIFDINVLDHIIVGVTTSCFSEQGIL